MHCVVGQAFSSKFKIVKSLVKDFWNFTLTIEAQGKISFGVMFQYCES